MLPGCWPADEDAGGETQWPKAGLCRQPGFSANASRWLSALCSASHHTCKIPKFHTHPNYCKNVYFLWLLHLNQHQFQSKKIKIRKFLYSFSKMYEFYSFLQQHGLGNPLCAGLRVRHTSFLHWQSCIQWNRFKYIGWSSEDSWFLCNTTTDHLVNELVICPSQGTNEVWESGKWEGEIATLDRMLE